MKHRILLILCIGLMISACQSKTTNDNETIDKSPVSFHHYFSGTLSGGIDDLVDIYNTSQQDYHIKVVPIDHEAYKTSILESFRMGAPADMNSYWAGSKTHEIVDYLVPLDDIYSEYNLLDQFNSDVLASAAYYDGHYYLIPITQHYVNFYYNIELFQRYGLNEPKNWDEFLDVCATLKAEGVTPIGLGAKNRWPAQFWFDYILLRTAGLEYRETLVRGEASYTDTEVIHTIEIWKELIDKGYFNDNATEMEWDYDVINPLMSGDYGMTLMGTWIMAVMDNEDNSDDYSGKYGVFSFPIINEDIELISLGPVDGIIIGKEGLNLAGAKDVVVEFTKLENQAKMAEGSGAFIPNINADNSYYSDKQIELLSDISKSKGWAFNFDLAVEQEVIDHGLNFFVEFLAFPEAYMQLLEDFENQVSN